MIEKYKTINGLKRWSTSISIPIEQSENSELAEHLKRELREKCVKEYVENTNPDLNYRTTTVLPGLVKLTVELEDLFALKEVNKRLMREMREIMDMYKVLKARHEKNN